MKYKDVLPATADLKAIEEHHLQKQKWVNQSKKGFLRYRTPFEKLREFRAGHISLSKDTVTIGKSGELNDREKQMVKANLKLFMPWRKGPFSVFGTDIDAEWRSEKKWRRIAPHLPDLKGKNIADIGCNNGYYMFRMAAHEPRFVLGLEPSVQHYYCFRALNSMAGLQNLHIDLLGVEQISLFKECFDVIFLMGIIYHRASPVDVLRDTFAALRPGGTLVIESQAIPGDESKALFPERTYAKVPGTYFVPTGKCLINWIERAGYSDIKLISSVKMSPAEQRKTDWMVFESFSDFLDPNNSELTIEGYPAPLRIMATGQKKR